MNFKKLTSLNGPLVQVTFTLRELDVLRQTVRLASLPAVAKLLDDDVYWVGKVLSNFALQVSKSDLFFVK